MRFWDEILKHDLAQEAPELKVPVYFMLGRHDYNAHPELARGYYEKLKAPMGKELIFFEESGHFPHWEEPGKFHEALVNRVLKKAPAQ